MTFNTIPNLVAWQDCIYDSDWQNRPDGRDRLRAFLETLSPGFVFEYRVTSPHSVEFSFNGKRHTLARVWVPDGGPSLNFDGRGFPTYDTRDGLVLGHWRWWEKGQPGEPLSDEDTLAFMAERLIPYNHGYVEWAGEKRPLRTLQSEEIDRTPFMKGDDLP